MCVVAFDQLAPAVAKQSVSVVLSDHHYWGGLQRSRLLSGICDTFGLGLSMHSNSHLGISLAAMVHLAGATPNLTYACDTHWPWKTEEVIKPGVLEIRDGSVAVPTTPGLGRRARRRRARRRCTSSTSGAGFATVTTPATCRASIRISRPSAPAGS